MFPVNVGSIAPYRRLALAGLTVSGAAVIVSVPPVFVTS